MTERQIRLWHRRFGTVLFVFLLIQALTGLHLSLPDDWMLPATHAHEKQPPEKTSSHPTPSQKSSPLFSFPDTSVESLSNMLHHGGGFWGDLYRIGLAVDLIFQALTGAWIAQMIRARSRK